jgi:hypothetical protein
VAAPAAFSCLESEARGRTDADQRKFNQGWFWGGVGITALLGGFGLGVAPAAGAVYKPRPKATPAGLDQACYAQGFGSKARHENALTAFLGSLVGLPLWILLYATAY